MSHINDVQSFKRAMIENGFSKDDDDSGNDRSIIYSKFTTGDIPDIRAYYTPRENEEDFLNDEPMMFIYLPDYKGENETYKAIYDQVKDECEFVEIRDGVGGDIAYYDCEYKKPSKEMIELNEEFEKIKVTESASDFLSFQVGFNKTETLRLLHFPAANKSHPNTLNFLTDFMKKMAEAKDSGIIDNLREQYKDSIN